MKIIRTITIISLLFLTGCGTSGRFIVKSEPAGAEIFVDGQPFGKTPTTVQIPFTENKQMVTEKKIISLKLKGYKEIKEVLSYQGDTSRVLSFQLEPAPAGS